MTSTGSLVLVFLAGFGLCIGAAEILLQGFLRIGARLGLSAGMVGLLAALGTDSPEIVSALAAIVHGDRDVGIGIVFGSNLFNLAALLGASLLIAGRITIPRVASLLDGAVALVVTAIAGFLVASLLPALVVVVLLLAVVGVYVALLSVKPARLPRLARPLVQLAEQIHSGQAAEERPRATGRWLLLIPVSLAAIVIGAVVMVDSALILGPRFGIPRFLLGTVVLAALTSLPDAYAAARLALDRQGAALVSECFNSNTINIVIGAGVPAAVLGSLASDPYAGANVLWLFGLTALVVGVFTWRVQVGRLVGLTIVAGYGAFLGLRLLG